MTDKEKELWLSVQYPITIICDRYNGTYSGAKWLAFPLDYDKIPSGVDASDPECAQFWKDYKEPVGKGASMSEALLDLSNNMRKSVESEDERIRKELIETIRCISSDCQYAVFLSEQQKQRYLAYLEKQKEQKPAEWSERHIADVFEKVGLAKIVREQGNDNLTNALQSAMIELASPAEWSEEDEKIITALTKALIGSDSAEKIMLFDGVTIEMVSDWLKSLRPQPKQGWSEEDESRLDHAITTLAENVKRGSAREDFEFLASLPRRFNLQPKTEWSKEDRRTIDRACVALRAYANGELPDILPSEILEYADKLQSLRPSWKPSEEQMEALNKARRFIPYNCDILESLYKQLKKL